METLLSAALFLEIPQNTLATALICFRSALIFDQTLKQDLLAATSIHIACKQTEVARKLRVLITFNSGYYQ
jgi:hypothetical protein